MSTRHEGRKFPSGWKVSSGEEEVFRLSVDEAPVGHRGGERRGRRGGMAGGRESRERRIMGWRPAAGCLEIR